MQFELKARNRDAAASFMASFRKSRHNCQISSSYGAAIWQAWKKKIKMGMIMRRRPPIAIVLAVLKLALLRLNPEVHEIQHVVKT